MATSSLPRVQLALNVSDVDAAVEFYGRLFDAEPAKRRPGYANFAIDSPPLKLVLIESPDAAGSLNHLGVEVASAADVAAATGRLESNGIAGSVESEVTCCYAVQDKVWSTDPDGLAWEHYTVLADASVMESVDSACCSSTAQPTDGACCAS